MLAAWLAALLAVAAAATGPASAQAARAAASVKAVPFAAGSNDSLIVDAREAFRRKERPRLGALRAAALAAGHPLAMWADYWDANLRLAELRQADLDAFYARWPASYVEDRLRNDWLLELGRRRDWAGFAVDFPRFRMNDDREATCYALLTDHLLAGKPVREPALAAWLAQRDADNGCALMAATLVDAGVLGAADAWRKARLSMDANRPAAARLAAALASPANAVALADVVDAPARFLTRNASARGRANAELATLALIRLATTTDGDAAAGLLSERWERALPADLAAWAWAAVAKQSAMRLAPDAADLFLRAERAQAARSAAEAAAEAEWPDDTLAWKVRAALRANTGGGRWQQVVQAVNAMSPAEQRDPAWVYWKARGLQALAGDSQEGDALRLQAREMLAGLADQAGAQAVAAAGSSSGAAPYTVTDPAAPSAAAPVPPATPAPASVQLGFYAVLAADRIGRTPALPARPAALSTAERGAAQRDPGLARALLLIAIGLRNEGVREWNYSLRGMGDRELLAAAQLACEREVWDRCINTSDRTRVEIDMAQRFPTPFRKQVLARSKEIGLDPAYVYGLIRQESRFIMDARSGVGASGLMQIMPATARWTAQRIGLPYSPDQITDRDTNVLLGTSYLKLMLDDFGGSQALAAAAYNAGPGRPRRWREGPPLEVAAWAENIPFGETRDYVKKVLSNATWYAALLAGEPVTLKSRAGRPIGPRDASAPPPDRDLP